MKNIRTDIVIIGAGTAGLAAYSAATAAGVRVVIVEGDDYGTTCARVGCMPSKLLIAAADAAQAIREAPGFGVHVDGLRIDGREVMARVRHERDRFVSLVVRDVEDIPAANRLRGHARFVDDLTLAIADHSQVTCKSIIIATGSRAVPLEAFTGLGDRLVSSDDIFNWHDLPAATAVIGPGIIGLELGQALHRLGVDVAVLGRGGRIGPISDPEIQAYAIDIFSKEFTLEPDAHISSMQRDGDHIDIRREGPEGTEVTGHFDYVLAATGRTPNIDGLGLDRTTLELDAKGVPRFDQLTTRTLRPAGKSPIFIAGDADNFIPLLHEAADEGRIAGENAARHALGKAVKKGLRHAPLSIVFTDPQIAIVGSGFHSLKPGSFATGQASFENQGRSRIMLKNQGLLNVYGDLASGRFLGAEMLAPAAEHLAHLLAWALQKKMFVADMLKMPFYHPVIEEGLRTALSGLHGMIGVR